MTLVMTVKKQDLLKEKIQHIDITAFDSTPLIHAYGNMAFQSRNLARACSIFNSMLQDVDCTNILCLAGSLVSAGLKKVIIDMIKHNMVDIIVSTGAIIVDQDFFEGLGFSHYRGFVHADDDELRNLKIDRIYDTFIDEEELRICDMTIKQIADDMTPGSYSSREFIREMGKYLENQEYKTDSFVRTAYTHEVPVFCPAFSDCSAGFGLVFHQHEKQEKHIAIDTVKDFRELTKLKIQSIETGLVVAGGGVPKNFVQDTVVAADILGIDTPMHKYAVQLTVADERDGGLSGSTFKEASSWGKVDQGFEQMVFGEATITFPLLVSYVYHQGSWKKRTAKRLNQLL
jgi:deoxyhypusine synthase